MLGVDGDREQVVVELALDQHLAVVGPEGARQPVLAADLDHDRAAAAPRGGEAEGGGDGRPANAALAHHEQQSLVEQVSHEGRLFCPPA